jgi:hypothetical protein
MCDEVPSLVCDEVPGLAVQQVCNCPFNDWARIVTQFFERRVIEYSDEQCHERRNGSKDRNYREKVPYHGTQHSRRSEDSTPHRGARRMAVQKFHSLTR